MLKIILMRHAAAQLEQYGKNDRERTIAMAGMHEIDALRPRLHGQFEGVSLVLCSNVKRTRQTLEGIRPFLPNSADIHFDDSLYQGRAETIWHKIQTTPPAHNGIMIIGHNPSLTNVVVAIDAAKMSQFPTCGVVILESDVKKWHEVSAHTLRIEKIFDVTG